MRRGILPGWMLCVALASGLALEVTAAPDSESAESFDRFAEEYLQAFFVAHPVRATKLGIHDYDSRLPDLSRAAIRRRVSALQEWLARLQAIDRDRLVRDASHDHLILERAIRAELLELEEVRGWQNNPMLYNRLMADSVASLVDRPFAPLHQRLDDLIARLEQFPQLLRTARKNLKNVPAPWTELATNNTRGHIKFLSEGAPAALRAQGLDLLDPQQTAHWATAQRRALRRLREFGPNRGR